MARQAPWALLTRSSTAPLAYPAAMTSHLAAPPAPWLAVLSHPTGAAHDAVSGWRMPVVAGRDATSSESCPPSMQCCRTGSGRPRAGHSPAHLCALSATAAPRIRPNAPSRDRVPAPAAQTPRLPTAVVRRLLADAAALTPSAPARAAKAACTHA